MSADVRWSRARRRAGRLLRLSRCIRERREARARASAEDYRVSSSGRDSLLQPVVPAPGYASAGVALMGDLLQFPRTQFAFESYPPRFSEENGRG